MPRVVWTLPTNRPQNLRCVPILLPDDPDYIRKFQGEAFKQLSRQSRWYRDDTGTGAKEVADIWQQAWIANSLGEASVCFDLEQTMLRTKPTDICVLQQSLDGGNTWNDVFDFGACLDTKDLGSGSETNIFNYFDETNIFYSDNRVIYNNNILNIWTNGGYGDGDDPERDAAQCFALGWFVDAICGMLIETKQRQAEADKNILNTVSDFFGAASSFATGLIGIGVTFISPWMAIGLALAGVAAELGALFTNADISLFEDLEAREDVQCCLFTALAGSAPTQTEFAQSLDSCSFAGGSNSEKLREIIAPFLEDLDVYITLYKNITEATDLAIAGAELPCPCPEPAQTLVCDFLVDDCGFTTNNGGNGQPYSAWSNGIGWQSQLQPSGGANQFNHLSLFHTISNATTVIAMRLTYDFVNGSGGVFTNGDRLALDDTTGTIQYFYLGNSPSNPTGSDQTVQGTNSVDTNPANGEFFITIWAATGNPPAVVGEVIATRLEIDYIGDPPF